MNRSSLYFCKSCLIYLGLFLFISGLKAQNKDVILQGFYWNTNPGDVTNVITGGVWWDTLAIKASKISDAGFDMIWMPNPVKGSAGILDMGYGPYDYYDLGHIHQKGTTRTRFGTRGQFLKAVDSIHSQGMKVLVDVILNHRGGADNQMTFECGGGLGWTGFNPASGRLPASAEDFHPNNTHCNQTPDYHDPLFFEDLCYFNNGNTILNNGAGDGWFFGPHFLGSMGDSLVTWIRWFKNFTSVDAFRLDAIKHIEPGFIAPFLVESQNGIQPFAFGEFFDGNPAVVKAYHDQVETYNGSPREADLAMNDFSLRFKLAEICNNTSGTANLSDLNNSGQLFGSGMDAEDIVTFIDNHDFDRIGYKIAGTSPPCPAGQKRVGSTCLELFTDAGHSPVGTDKHMGYAYILAAEGHPIVFWKDYFWYGLKEELNWLINLRNHLAGGTSTPISGLSPVYGASWSGSDLHVLSRSGDVSKSQAGCLMIMNDRISGTGDVWVNTPFTDMQLKDYSDGFLLETTSAFTDSRANLKASNRDYSWYAPTGLYPVSKGNDTSKFTMEASPGGYLHYIALTNTYKSSYLVNGLPVETGDQIAVIGPSGDIMFSAGIGRVGQGFGWDNNFDMLFEVLGGATEPEAKGGFLNGDSLSLVVYDKSENEYVRVNKITFAQNGTSFSFNPKRPLRKGSSINILTDFASPVYQKGGRSLVTSFSAGCREPDHLNVQVTGEDDVRLSWYLVNGAQGYFIRGKQIGASSYVNIHLNSGFTSSYNAKNLNPNVQYIWQIATKCDIALGVQSEWSEVDTFSINDLVNCYPPSATLTTNITSSSAKLNWFFSTGALGYQIKGRQVGTGYVKIIVLAPSTSYTATSLSPNTTYEWQVRTICDPSGLGSGYTPLESFTTLGPSKQQINPYDGITLIPNPAGESSLVSWPSFMDIQQIEMYDSQGKRINQWTVHHLNSLPIEKNKLPVGLYLLKMISGNDTHFRKLIFN